MSPTTENSLNFFHYKKAKKDKQKKLVEVNSGTDKLLSNSTLLFYNDLKKKIS